MEVIRIGTRKSKLALAQSQWVRQRLEETYPGIRVELVKITTTGDKILDSPLARVGGKGLFVKEIEEALLRGEIDIAVHSMKDLPFQIPEGLEILAYPIREDIRDALVSPQGSHLDELPEGGVVGTSSLRRTCQLLRLRPDLRVVPIRGNVDTRLKKLETEGLSAILLAMAGIKRLGLHLPGMVPLSPERFYPALGQGALAVEGPKDNKRLKELLSPLNHKDTELSIRAERAFLETVEGGCQVPMGGYTEVDKDELIFHAMILDEKGKEVVVAQKRGPKDHCEALGRELAHEILGRGGREVIQGVWRKRDGER
jgi:hydroxymethylbilane synthase